jgi:hypothetical protein
LLANQLRHNLAVVEKQIQSECNHRYVLAVTEVEKEQCNTPRRVAKNKFEKRVPEFGPVYFGVSFLLPLT